MRSTLPYLYTRGAFMKRKLFGKEDYAKIMKMGLSEIIRFLEETHYKKAIDELALTLKGPELMESALNLSLAEEFSKMRRMADADAKKLLDAYLERWDVENAKVVLRIAQSKTDVKKAEHAIIAAGKFHKGFFLDLLKLQSIEEMVKRMECVSLAIREEMLRSYAQSRSILELESILDKQYYSRMFKVAKRLGSDSALIKKFLSDEVMIVNLRLATRLIAEGMDSAQIKKHLIAKEGVVDSQIQSILSAHSVEGAIEAAQKGAFAKFLRGIDNPTTLDVEIACTHYLIETYASSLYMNPYSITPLLTVMFVKSAEVQNLKGLMKARELGLDQEFIEKKVIVPCWR